MFSVPDGRAANQPLAQVTLMPPIGASLPGARLSTLSIFSPASVVCFISCGESLASRDFCAGLAGAVALPPGEWQPRQRWPARRRVR